MKAAEAKHDLSSYIQSTVMCDSNVIVHAPRDKLWPVISEYKSHDGG